MLEATIRHPLVERFDAWDTRGQWLRVERFGVARLMLAFTRGHSRVERFGVAPLTLEFTLLATLLTDSGQWLRVERHGPEDCKQRRESSTLFIHAEVHEQGNGKNCGLHCDDGLLSRLGS
jgi:hypothetical protein